MSGGVGAVTTAVACGQALPARRPGVGGTPAALTVAARGTPHPAQAPRAVVKSKSRSPCDLVRSTHDCSELEAEPLGERRVPAERTMPRNKPNEAANPLWSHIHRVQRDDRAVVRPAQRGSGGGRGHSAGRRAGPSAAARLLRPLATTASRKPLARKDQCRPRRPTPSHAESGCAAARSARRRLDRLARRRVAASQRGRRAGDLTRSARRRVAGAAARSARGRPTRTDHTKRRVVRSHPDPTAPAY
jgi:hypothetical protein